MKPSLIVYPGLRRGICLFFACAHDTGAQSFEMCHLAFMFFRRNYISYNKPKDTIRSFSSSSLEHGHEFVGRQEIEQNNG